MNLWIPVIRLRRLTIYAHTPNILREFQVRQMFTKKLKMKGKQERIEERHTGFGIQKGSHTHVGKSGDPYTPSNGFK